MTPFTELTAIAAPFPEAQIDTDVIFPARFLLLLDKTGLGRHLFSERRARGGFVLDTPPWTAAQILVTGPDFGTGSSREQAVWALRDFGIRCVIGPSFGEIFTGNCYRNGVLPVTLGGAPHAEIMSEAQAGRPVSVDLPAEVVRLSNGRVHGFAIEPQRKRALVLGLDEIGQILADDLADILAYEERARAAQPWLFLSGAQFPAIDDEGGDERRPG